MRTCVLVCASAFALCANAAESGWFGFSLDGYANGQALGPGVGGEWQAASVVATNVFDGVRNGIAISPDMEEEIAFAPVAPPNGRDVERIDVSLSKMLENAAWLWEADSDFRKKTKAQPYFCLPHYRHLLQYGQKRLSKKKLSEFVDQCETVVMNYMSELTDDVSWFCKKFDYRYDEEPWYNSKDSVERAIKFLRSDIHVK